MELFERPQISAARFAGSLVILLKGPPGLRPGLDSADAPRLVELEFLR